MVQNKERPFNFRLAQVLLGFVLAAPLASATCQSALAQKVAKAIADEVTFNAEMGPFIQDASLPRVEFPVANRTKGLILDLSLEAAHARRASQIYLSPDFGLITFHSEKDKASLSMAIGKEYGRANTAHRWQEQPGKAISAVEAGNILTLFSGSEQGSNPKDLGYPVSWIVQDHVTELNQARGSSKAKPMHFQEISKAGLVIKEAPGIAIGMDKDGTLKLFQTSVLEGNAVYNSFSFVFETGEPVRVGEGSAEFPRFHDSAVLYDTNTGTLAIRLKGPKSDPDLNESGVRYYIASAAEAKLKDGTPVSVVLIRRNQFITTAEPEAFSFSFLKRHGMVAFKDAIGDFHIRNAKPFEGFIQDYVKIKASSEKSENFPKVLSYEEGKESSFVLLKEDGTLTKWNADTLKEEALFGHFNGQNPLGELIEGMSLSQDTVHTFLWGATKFKLFETHTRKQVREFNLPEDLSGKVKNILFSPDKSLSLLVLKDGSGVLLENRSGLVEKTLDIEKAELLATAFQSYNATWQEK